MVALVLYRDTVIWCVMVFLSLLMVSTIPFPTPQKQQRLFKGAFYVRHRWSYGGLVAALCALMLVLCAYGYPIPLYGMALYLIGTLLHCSITTVLASW
jgi:phosphatidylserine synthase